MWICIRTLAIVLFAWSRDWLVLDRRPWEWIPSWIHLGLESQYTRWLNHMEWWRHAWVCRPEVIRVGARQEESITGSAVWSARIASRRSTGRYTWWWWSSCLTLSAFHSRQVWSGFYEKSPHTPRLSFVFNSACVSANFRSAWVLLACTTQSEPRNITNRL